MPLKGSVYDLWFQSYDHLKFLQLFCQIVSNIHIFYQVLQFDQVFIYLKGGICFDLKHLSNISTISKNKSNESDFATKSQSHFRLIKYIIKTYNRHSKSDF